jgi:glycosyltransferase involved in cell wall biosynthesis
MVAPKISVIVTNFNYGRYLFECVESIRNQTFKDFELIIVDDASTDGSQSLVGHLADKAVTFKKNQGTRVASNTGVQVASGTYCVFVNADDRLDPEFLSLNLATLESDPSLSLTYTDFWHFGQSGDKKIDNGVVFPEWDVENLKKFNFVLCSALFKRDVFDKVGGLQVDYGMEDYDLWLRMALQGHTGKRTPGYLYHYRAHNSNRTHGVNVEQAMENIKSRNGVSNQVVAYPDSTEIVFSICYATRRSWCIKTVIGDWLEKASNRKSVEFIIGVDADDRASIESGKEVCRHVGNTHLLIQSSAPFNCIKAWNATAKMSKGKVLVMISDDFVPPKNWDSQLVALQPNWINESWVVRVNDCNNSTTNKPFTLPILTRVRYEKLGYVFWPEYESLFSDTEFGEHAKLDGVVIDARTLLFEHLHHTCYKRKQDAVDSAHSSDERWDSGKAIYNRREACGFVESNRAIRQKSNLDLTNAWKAFSSSVKTVVYSVSLEASLWLENMVDKSDKLTALEMGSNFSSVVFSATGLDTTTADVNHSDTQGVRRFMSTLGLSVTTTTLSDMPLKKFDIIFVNAYEADSQDRYKLIVETAPKYLKDDGVLVLNDGHFVNVRKAMDALVAVGWKAEIPQQTMDKYDRYCMVLKH